MLSVAGTANPVSLYLLPLIIAAITLPAVRVERPPDGHVLRQAVRDTLRRPLVRSSGYAAVQPTCSACGSTSLSALAVAFFVVRLAQDVQQRDAWLAARTEEALRNERIVALGALAAGTAHELGTPLSTMAVLLGRWGATRNPALAGDIAVLRSQVDTCKQAITRMVAAAGAARAESASYRPLDEFLTEALERWRLMRPAVQPNSVSRVRYRRRRSAEQTGASHPEPDQNAADASPQAVEVDAS
jgi:two-component system sensor histidine kinase RegB